MEIIIDNNGENIGNAIDLKYDRVTNLLREKLENIALKIAQNEQREKPIKLNFNSQISNWLNVLLQKEPKLKYSDAIELDGETLQVYYDKFLELLMFIYDYAPEYVPSKIVFSSWCGFTTDVYNKLRYGTNSEIVDILSHADDLFVETNWASAQSGISREKSTTDRMRERTFGQGLDLKPDNSITMVSLAIDKTPEARQQQLENIMKMGLLSNKNEK